MMETKVPSRYEEFLFFGYVPIPAEADLQWLDCDLDYDIKNRMDDETWWISEGVKTLKQTMAEQVASTPGNALHVLPLSGGLDSRAILGGLLENLSGLQIVAATYGIPGSWDFEFAKVITRKLGLRHELFNLLEDKWNIEELILAGSRLKYPVSVHQSYIRQKITNCFGADCVYWSGFMGGHLAGTWDLPKTPSVNQREAVQAFLNLVSTTSYRDQEFQTELAEKLLADCAWDALEHPKLSLDQQLNLGIKQKFCLHPTNIIEGFNFKTPYPTRNWASFMLHVPRKWRQGSYLYKRIIAESYQDLAKLPSRNAAGMPVMASKTKVAIGKAVARIKPYVIHRDPYFSHPRTTYMNFTESLRHKCSFQDMAYATLQGLKTRQIFNGKDIERWWSEHQNRKKDHTDLLLNLSSLELLLAAGRI